MPSTWAASSLIFSLLCLQITEQYLIQLCRPSGEKISSCLGGQGPRCLLDRLGFSHDVQRILWAPNLLPMSQHFSGVYRGCCEGIEIPDKVRAKGSERMFLVTAVIQIKSPETPVSSLVVQNIRRLPAASSWALALPSSNDRGCFLMLFICERTQLSLLDGSLALFWCCFCHYFFLLGNHSWHTDSEWC